jgi:hypothetical protein
LAYFSTFQKREQDFAQSFYQQDRTISFLITFARLFLDFKMFV